MNEAERMRKAIVRARKSGMSIASILALIEKVYGGTFRSFVWRVSK